MKSVILVGSVSLALLMTGCAQTIQLGTESNDHSASLIASCGAGLDQGLVAKAQAELQKNGQVNAEAVYSVKSTLVSDGTLQSADRQKAYDTYTKCVLEMDQRIRSGAKVTVGSNFEEKKWYLDKASYEGFSVSVKKKPPYTVEATYVDEKSGKSETKSASIDNAAWLKFMPHGVVVTNLTMAPKQATYPNIFFQFGSESGWSSDDEDKTVDIQAMWQTGSEAPQRAKYSVNVNGGKLTLKRLEGAPNTLTQATFHLE